jgi:hypothetical protein
VAVGDAIEKRRVKLGVASRTVAEVASGLAPGDKVIVPQAEPSKAPAASPAPRGGRSGMGARL